MVVLINPLLKKIVKKKKKIKKRIVNFRQRNVNETHLKQKTKKKRLYPKNYEPFPPSERFHHRLVHPSRSMYIFPRMA